jgi:spermidine synthase
MAMVSDRPLRLLVFASGAAGLAYEISWSRQLGLVFGQTARAAAIVLGAYFLGMALGYALAARRSARMDQPLGGFALAELVVGAWAFAVPALLTLAPVHVESVPARVLLALLVLLPGTTALGASLPFVAQAAAGAGGGTERVAGVYAANLAGAVLGVVLATGMLAPVGVVTTSWAAASVSIAVGGCAWLLRVRFAMPTRNPSAADGDSAVAPSSDALWLVAAAVSGFGALGAQVLYVRLFSLVFHNSTYTFAAILIVVLVGLSLSSALGGRLLRRFDPTRALLAASLVAGVGLPVSVCAFLQLQGFRYFGWGDTFASYLIAATGLVAAVVLVPVLAMGLLLPLAWHLAGADDRPGPVVGRLTTANTLFAALGATGTSFVLVPLLDLWWSFAGIAAVYLVLAALVTARLDRHRARWAGAIGLAAVAALGATVLSTRVDALKSDEVLVARFAGPYGWTDVTADTDGYHQRIRHNIHYGLGSRSSSPMQLRQGQFPLLLHPDPKQVAFIGLATGVTASAALDRPEVESITVMELIPEVVQAARLFERSNRGLLDDERVTVRIGDGRNVLGSATARYDVIVSDLFVPWESKTGYLYTVEHFTAVRERLADGGIFCQWLAGWQVGPRELEIIAQSLREAFPHVAIWQLSRDEDRPLFALVAVDDPRHLERDVLQARMAQRSPPALGRERVLRTADDVVAWYLGDWTPLEGVPLNTDEHPVIEFSAPITQREKDNRLRKDGFHAYYAERLGRLPRSVFTFEPPAGDAERKTPR